MSDFTIRDSGERREFETGAVRDVQVSKPRPDLISPYALWRIGVHLAKGAEKYGPRNWEKGMPFSVFVASLCRHLVQYMMKDRVEDHLAAICFNVMAIMHFEETGRKELDDL